jgi:hypothetical protein
MIAGEPRLCMAGAVACGHYRWVRLRAWVLGAHAFVVGIGFLALGLPVVLVLADHPAVEAAIRGRVANAPAAVSFGALAVVGYYALPLLWPLHLGIGLYEANLIPLLRRGARRAATSARRVLVLQAVAFLVLGLVVATWTRWWPTAAIPVAVGCIHFLLGRWMIGHVEAA